MIWSLFRGRLLKTWRTHLRPDMLHRIYIAPDTKIEYHSLVKQRQKISVHWTWHNILLLFLLQLPNAGNSVMLQEIFQLWTWQRKLPQDTLAKVKNMPYPFFKTIVKKCLLLNSDGINMSLQQETNSALFDVISQAMSRITNPSSGVKHTWRFRSRDWRRDLSQISR